MPKKIEYAVRAADLFIQHLHRPIDRCLLATFGNTFFVEQGFTPDEPQLHSALSRIRSRFFPFTVNEGTRLYDSIKDAIVQFQTFSDRDRPCLLTVITAGQDNFRGGEYENNPAGIGRFVATNYHKEYSHFIYVIGVGEYNQFDAQALATMGEYGNFPSLIVGGFPFLEEHFLRNALWVSARLQGIMDDYGNLSWGEVAQVWQASALPFDYAFLLDSSGSMNEEG